MDGFYGGLKGQDFSIKQVFTSYAELETDLSKGWTSPISPNEYVLVSYGMPNDPSYDSYKNQDLLKYGKTYNSTLWQKIYVDSNGNANGLQYTLIASMTGNTPKLTITKPITKLNANQDPDVSINTTNVDNPILTFSLPKSQVLQQGTTTVVSSNVSPSFTIDSSDINKPILSLKLPRAQLLQQGTTNVVSSNVNPSFTINSSNIDKPVLSFNLPRTQVLQQGTTTVVSSNVNPSFTLDSTNIDKPVISFALPKSQVMQNAILDAILAPGQTPEVTLDTTDIDKPVLRFKLPAAQIWKQGTTTVLDADEDPSFTVTDDPSNQDTKIISFALPQAQVMVDPETIVKNSKTIPGVTMDDSNVNAPKLTFTLPRAAKFVIESFLNDSTATVTIPSGFDLDIGDFFISKDTGYMYEVISPTEMQYKTSFQVDTPEIINEAPISPYRLDGTDYVPNEPQVSADLTATGWGIKFNLPTAPKAEATYDFLGAEEEGSAEVTIKDADTLNFDFKIPRGVKQFVGEDVYDGKYDAIIPDSLPGDIYLNGSTGFIYKLNKYGVWEKQPAKLKGPVGDALHIVREYRLTETDTLKNSLSAGVDHIIAEYGATPGPDELFSIIWIDADNVELGYWYYLTEDNVWGRVQITGDISNILEQEYNDEADEPVTTKAYSVHYVNSLIGNKILNPSLETFSADQMYALLSWGTFDETGIPDWYPDDPIDTTTLSANEVIKLMSWGEFGHAYV